MKNINKESIASELSRYYFDQIWNEPPREYLVNIRTLAIKKGSSFTGHCYLATQPLVLPTNTKSFHIYRFSSDNIGGIYFPNNQWLNALELCNGHNIIIHSYASNGLILPKTETYFYKAANSSIVTLAINKQYIKAFGIREEDIYITYNRDSTIGTEVTVYSNLGDVNDIRYLIQNNSSNRHQLICFLNGYNVSTEKAAASSIDDTLDIIIDKNIVAEFDIDVTSDPKTYYSTQDKLYKEIVHIPKSLNPDNLIITHNTLDFYIRDQHTGKGTYLHQTAEKGISQITHNDIGIPRYILDAHKDTLGSSDISVNVKIRHYDKQNYLVKNGSYIDILYRTQNDDNIIQHLLGTIDSENLSFWMASELEQSYYVKAMSVYQHIRESNLDKYVEALGWYNTIAILTNTILTYEITEETENATTFRKPSLWAGHKTVPLVYKNKTKIPQQYVPSYDTNTHTVISLENIIKNIGDKFSIFFFLKGRNDYDTFLPDANNNTMVISNLYGFYVYEVQDTDKINGMYDVTYRSYKKLDLDMVNIVVFEDTENSTYSIRFGNDLYGKQFIILSDTYNHYSNWDIDHHIDSDKAIIIPITQEDTEENNTYPILEAENTLVYMNKNYLVEGIDYRVVTTKDAEGNTALKHIAIQCIDYLEEEGNNVEIYVHSQKSLYRDTGYVTNDTISRDMDVDIDIPGITMVHVNGQYEYEEEYQGTQVVLPPNVYENGQTFELKTNVPQAIIDNLSEEIQIADKDRITKITEYLSAFNTEIGEIILPKSYRVMSSYFFFIMQKILKGELAVNYDPVDSNMLKQIRAYDDLKRYDLLFNENNIDLKFVDIWPAYKDYTTDDPNKRKVIKKLFEIIFTKDKQQSGVTVND